MTGDLRIERATGRVYRTVPIGTVYEADINGKSRWLISNMPVTEQGGGVGFRTAKAAAEKLNKLYEEGVR